MSNKVTKTGEQGLELICHFESLHLTAYLCPAGVWTIGYGTTHYPDGSRVKKGDHIDSKDVALKLMRHDLARFEKAVDKYTRDDIEQHEFDALVSAVYNLGEGFMMQASLIPLINKYCEDKDLITRKFGLWNKARIDGYLKELPGLTRRRRAEAHLFNHNEVKFYKA